MSFRWRERNAAAARNEALDKITLDDLLAKVADDGAGCLVWRHYADHGKYPQWRLAGCEVAARRTIYRLVHGGHITRGHQVAAKCGTLLCVHPDHLVARKKCDAHETALMPAMHRVNSTRAKRASSKLTQAQVLEIRQAHSSSATEAARYGISRTHHHRIRTQRAWVDLVTPWTGLLPR